MAKNWRHADGRKVQVIGGLGCSLQPLMLYSLSVEEGSKGVGGEIVDCPVCFAPVRSGRWAAKGADQADPMKRVGTGGSARSRGWSTHQTEGRECYVAQQVQNDGRADGAGLRARFRHLVQLGRRGPGRGARRGEGARQGGGRAPPAVRPDGREYMGYQKILLVQRAYSNGWVRVRTEEGQTSWLNLNHAMQLYRIDDVKAFRERVRQQLRKGWGR